MKADKIKAALASSLAGKEPTDAEVAGVIEEVVDIVVSISSSLERIADAQQRIAEAHERIAACAKTNGLNPDTLAFHTAG